MKIIYSLIFILCFTLSCSDSYAAMRIRTKMPKQSYSRQIGGNAKQKTKVEYDRGGKKYTKDVLPGQTRFVPKDAKNININGMRIRQGERVTTSPHGASLFDD